MQALCPALLLAILALLALLPSLSLSASPAFPSYSSYAGKPYTVSYDARSLRLNGEPVVFMSGSIHYPRSTPAMWPGLMKAAAADGLNMIQIYVFWNWHEPVEGQLDWSGRGNLTLFLDAIAAAGLFANLRIGPYVCAEWDYGGIPTWLAYKEGIRFRSYNDQWRAAVQRWVSTVVNVTRAYFADRGGPIVLAQIENELSQGGDPRYVQWNGDMAESMDVHVPWLMCNGVSANNTINTCNGNDCVGFLMSNGQSGRILKDQPALWTENEGWFESWGDVTYPEGSYSDRLPEEIAYTVVRWFARGGSHMNYYMYHGGNHYDRTAAAGLTNKYADGVNFHSDGLPNEPKKSHLMRLHQAIATVAFQSLTFPAQYNSSISLMWRPNSTGPWQIGKQQIAFVYGGTVFIENTATSYVQAFYEGMSLDMAASSILIFHGGNVLYNTSAVRPATVERVDTPLSNAPLDWQAWAEGVYFIMPHTAASIDGMPTVRASRPQEQLNLTRDLTDYLWYSFTRDVQVEEANATMSIDSGSANAFVVFWDGAHAGSCYNSEHQWTTTQWQCRVSIGHITTGSHTLSFLSVSLGIENGMNADEIPFETHFKGVRTGGSVRTAFTDFTAGVWMHRPYLTGEYLGLYTVDGWSSVAWTSEWKGLVGQPLVWWTAAIPAFSLPTSGQWALLVDLRGFGRGHFYINGHDGGRYWLVQGKGSQYPTQWLYHIPQDWMVVGGDNRITVVEELGAEPSRLRFVISQMRSLNESEAWSHVEAVDARVE